MLNLNRDEQSLTQGQALGEQIVLSRSVRIDEMDSTVRVVQPESALIDPRLLAQIVLKLLREDLRLDRERRRAGR